MALIDPGSIDIVGTRIWYAAVKRKNIYAATNIAGKTVKMHRMIVGTAGLIDHKNRNSLDNRLSNLRPATLQQNAWNFQRHAQVRTQFRGVQWKRKDRRYHAWFNHDGKKLYIGTYRTAEEAALAYDRTILPIRGEFAVLNFPEEASAAEGHAHGGNHAAL